MTTMTDDAARPKGFICIPFTPFRKARLMAVYAFARIMGVPVRVRDEYYVVQISHD